MALVDFDSRWTKGAEIVASVSMGQATSLAMASALCWPRRLGTSSPTTIDAYVMETTITVVAATLLA